MQISIEQKDGVEKILNVTIPSEEIQSQVESKINEYGKQVQLKGFRRGRVPKKLLIQRFGSQARQEVLGDLMNEAIKKAVEENELALAGNPEVQEVKDLDDGGFNFTARLETFPEIPEIDFSSITIEKDVAEVTEKDVDDMLKKLQKQRQEWKDSAGKIANGDLVTLQYSAIAGDETIPAEGTEKMIALLGESPVPESLKKALIGLKKGESGEVEVTFPEDFAVSELAGKETNFKFKIENVKKAKLPKVDEEFVKSFGIESGLEEDLRKDIRANLERELKNALELQAKNAILAALREQCADIKLPESMVRQEAAALAQQATERARQMGLANIDALPPEQFREQAIERLLNALIIGDIARKENVQVDFTRVREKVNEIAETFENPAQIVELYYSNPDLMSGVENTILESQVIELIADKVNTTEKKKSFADILNPEK